VREGRVGPSIYLLPVEHLLCVRHCAWKELWGWEGIPADSQHGTEGVERWNWVYGGSLHAKDGIQSVRLV
jgi:hypothetical protein